MADDVTTVGRRIGVYELQELIGAGGMGRVYRARDTRLHREVAVKILPELVAAEDERLRRFEREARLLASLNHANIAAIYDVVEDPPALILEFVDGPTLGDRIAAGPIPVRESLALAKQIAVALDAAHGKGVVHRDLKPANIKIASDGTVKLLDFGIAKVINDDATAATTIVSDTRAGVVIGTAGYMSPEQARGLPVDKRADIWAFGCVLFEMLAGHAAFARPTQSDTFAAILEREPDWSRLPSQVGPQVRRLLQRCLEKDPQQRLRDIGDAITELASDTPRVPRFAYRIAVGIGAAAAITLGGWLLRGSFGPALAPESRQVIDDISFESPHVAFSPDGTSLVIDARFDRVDEPLVLLKGGSSDRRTLPGTDGGMFPFWSPDGKSIGFFADRKLKRIDLTGETVQELADAPVGRGGAWTSDGWILFSPLATSPFFRVPAGGGQVLPLTTLMPGQNDHRAPVILPGGQHFIYYSRGAPTVRGVYVANIDGSMPRRLLNADAAAVYTPSGHLLFVRENQMFAQRFDADTLTLNGEPAKIADHVSLNRGVSLATLAASSTGSIAYATSSARQLQFAWFDRSGKQVRIVGSPETNPVTNLALSPDGRTLAFARLVDSGNWDIWFMEMDRGVINRVTSESSLDFNPVWMPDNKTVIYRSQRRVEADLYRRALGGNDELLLQTSHTITPMDVSRDGRFLLFGSATSVTDTDIWILPLDRNSEPQAVVAGRFLKADAQFSKDGRWIAYSSNETGRFEIYLRAITGGVPVRVSTEGGTLPRWAHSGNELFYLAPDGRLMSVSVAMQAAAPRIGRPAALFMTPSDPSGFSVRSPFVVGNDDQHFLTTVAIGEPTPSTLVLINHWQPSQ